ncbi:MAG TPA: hypothetical protein VFZ23_05990 [Pyrinomonadaceae bacterium]
MLDALRNGTRHYLLQPRAGEALKIQPGGSRTKHSATSQPSSYQIDRIATFFPADDIIKAAVRQGDWSSSPAPDTAKDIFVWNEFCIRNFIR